MPQSEMGQIVLKWEGVSGLNLVTLNVMDGLGDFAVGGQGSEEADSGVVPLSGIHGGRFTSTNQAEHALAVGTQNAFSPALNGSLIFEARVQFNNTATKECFIGFSDVPLNTLSVEVDIVTGATGTMTNVGSDFCGFFQSADLTDVNDWHLVHNGGSAAASSLTSSEIDGTTFGVSDIVAGEWQILRIEIDPNGTVRWYVDGELVKTVVDAASTTVLMGAVAAVEAKGSAIEEMDVNYLLFRANRDWTV